MSIWTLDFWKGAAERVIASTAGGAIAVLGSDLFGAFETDWRGVASVAAGAGIASLLKTLATGAKNGTASFGALEQPAPPKAKRHDHPPRG